MKKHIKTLDRQDLTSMLAKELNCSKPQALATLNIFLETFKKGLEENDRIKLVDFGILEKKQRKGRKGRNPNTGEIMAIPPKTIINFKASKSLLGKIN